MKSFIYQICYSEETSQSIQPGFLLLDNLTNERSDWRELWVIRKFLKNNNLDDDSLYGFLSPKFSQKTLLDHQGIQDFLISNYQGEDLVSFSPFWDLMAIFKNVFEQGEFFHSGLSNTCQQFAEKYLPNLNLVDSIMDSRNTIFCNYFLANKFFWSNWLNLADQLFEAAENPKSVLFSLLNSSTTYGVQQLPMKVFVQERLVSICLLANPNFKCLNYSPFNTGPSTTPFNQFFHEAVVSDALKRAYLQTRHASYLNEFANLRTKVIQSLKSI